MISRRAQENIFAVVIFILFATVLFLSYGYGPRARMVPVPLAIFGIILIIIQVIWHNLRSSDDLHIDTLELFAGRKMSSVPKGGGKASADVQPPGRKKGWRRWLDSQIAPFVLVGLLLILFFVLGPLPAVFGFTAGYLILSGQCKWLQGLIYAVALSILLYLLFSVALEVDLNRGLIIPFIDQFIRF